MDLCIKEQGAEESNYRSSMAHIYTCDNLTKFSDAYDLTFFYGNYLI